MAYMKVRGEKNVRSPMSCRRSLGGDINDRYIYADFMVTPLAPHGEGVIQPVKLVSAENVVVTNRDMHVLRRVPGIIKGKVPETVTRLKIDMSEQRKLQAAVDGGHQPWRYDAVNVGFVAAKEINGQIEYDDCKEKDVYDIDATIICRRPPHVYAVHLKKIVRPDGIWTATSVETIKSPNSR